MENKKNRYQRNIKQLESAASKFWLADLIDQEQKFSIIPILLGTQDQFLHLLSLNINTPTDLFAVLEHTRLPANIFLKHLIVLADFGGEMLKRVSKEHADLFPANHIEYTWGNTNHIYEFQSFPNRKFDNNTLKISGKYLSQNIPLSALQKDAIMLLLMGSHHNPQVLAKCNIGEYIGKSDELHTFVKQRYIWVSRITSGAMVNSLGQLTQQFVSDYIKAKHPALTVNLNGRLPNVSHTTSRDTSFDIVVTNQSKTKYVAIEVSFQVTTNSVIERKAGQAKARFERVKAAGHKIAYVIDGAGNFERKTALETICGYSHCTVAFSKSELDVLCDFLAQTFEDDR